MKMQNLEIEVCRFDENDVIATSCSSTAFTHCYISGVYDEPTSTKYAYGYTCSFTSEGEQTMINSNRDWSEAYYGWMKAANGGNDPVGAYFYKDNKNAWHVCDSNHRDDTVAQ